MLQKVRKSSTKSKIHIQSHLLSKDTQYCEHCNNAKLHAVQCTSTNFLTNAYFNNKGYTSIHKSQQKLEFHKIFAFNHAIILPVALRAAHTCRYLVYSEADFEIFAPQGRHVAPMG